MKTAREARTLVGLASFATLLLVSIALLGGVTTGGANATVVTSSSAIVPPPAQIYYTISGNSLIPYVVTLAPGIVHIVVVNHDPRLHAMQLRGTALALFVPPFGVASEIEKIPYPGVFPWINLIPGPGLPPGAVVGLIQVPTLAVPIAAVHGSIAGYPANVVRGTLTYSFTQTSLTPFALTVQPGTIQVKLINHDGVPHAFGLRGTGLMLHVGAYGAVVIIAYLTQQGMFEWINLYPAPGLGQGAVVGTVLVHA